MNRCRLFPAARAPWVVAREPCVPESRDLTHLSSHVGSVAVSRRRTGARRIHGPWLVRTGYSHLDRIHQTCHTDVGLLQQHRAYTKAGAPRGPHAERTREEQSAFWRGSGLCQVLAMEHLTTRASALAPPSSAAAIACSDNFTTRRCRSSGDRQ